MNPEGVARAFYVTGRKRRHRAELSGAGAPAGGGGGPSLDSGLLSGAPRRQVGIPRARLPRMSILNKLLGYFVHKHA